MKVPISLAGIGIKSVDQARRFFRHTYTFNAYES
ncbi:MAG: hypothetical protein PWP08_765 [Methanofollis sp.]|nr:hypothetical protein [Methanofollis sp.]